MHRLIILFVITGFFCVDHLNADEATDVFRQLYAGRIAKAKSSREADDDIELAKELVASTGQAGESPKLFELLCENAYTLGMRDGSGYDTAISAMRKLGAKFPDKAASCQEKIAEVHRRRYETADATIRREAARIYIDALLEAADSAEATGQFMQAAKVLQKTMLVARTAKSSKLGAITERLKVTKKRALVERQIKTYESRLKKDPNDAGAHEKLFNIYLIDMDDPDRAAPYAAKGAKAGDPARQLAPLAAKLMVEIGVDDLRRMGKWYQDLAAKPGAPKSKMLARAKSYLRQYLVVHTTPDLNRAQAEVDVKKIDTQMTEVARAESGAALQPDVPEGAAMWFRDRTKSRAPEAKKVVNEISRRWPGMFEGHKGVELISFYQGGNMMTDRGKRTPWGGAFSQACMYGTGPGAVVYGPGARLKAGTYIVTFRFKSKNYSSSSSSFSSGYGPINYDIAVGVKKVATGSVTPGYSGDWMFKALKVTFDEDKSKVQYRVWPNKRYCTVDRIWVFRMAD